jgi:hypothetical protein
MSELTMQFSMVRTSAGGPVVCITADAELAVRAADRCAGIVVPLVHLTNASEIETIMPGYVMGVVTIEPDGEIVTKPSGTYMPRLAPELAHLPDPLPPVEATLQITRTEPVEVSAYLTAGGWGRRAAIERVQEAAITVVARILAGMGLDTALRDAGIPIIPDSDEHAGW